MFVKNEPGDRRQVGVQRQETVHTRPKPGSANRENERFQRAGFVVEAVNDRLFRGGFDFRDVLFRRQRDDVRFVALDFVRVGVRDDRAGRQVDDDDFRRLEHFVDLRFRRFAVGRNEPRRFQDVDLLVERLVLILQPFERDARKGNDNRADDANARRDAKRFKNRFVVHCSFPRNLYRASSRLTRRRMFALTTI